MYTSLGRLLIQIELLPSFPVMREDWICPRKFFFQIPYYPCSHPRGPPVNLWAGQRIRLEEWSVCAATEAGNPSKFDGMKFWKSGAQAPAQSSTSLVQVCCGSACLSIENIQAQNLSGQYSPLCLHSPILVPLVTTQWGSCWPLLDCPLDSFGSNWTSSSPPGFFFTMINLHLSGLEV